MYLSAIYGFFLKLFKRKSIQDQFKDMLRRINSIDFINCGGCGVVALTIYKWLKKHKMLSSDFKFIFVYRGDSVMYSHNHVILTKIDKSPNLIKNLLVPSHIVIYNDGNYYDSNGLLVDFYSNLQHNVLDVNAILTILNETIDDEGDIRTWDLRWNCMFNRKKNVPLIEKYSGIKLNEVKTV